MLQRYTLNAVATTEQTITHRFPFSVNHQIVITEDGNGIAETLKKNLAEQNCHANIVKEIPQDCDVIIFLDALKPCKTIDEAIQLQSQFFLQIKQVAERFARKGGILITVQNTGGQFGLTDYPEINAWRAGLTGFIKTAIQEWPNVNAKAIDINIEKFANPNQIAEKILTELMQPDGYTEIGYLDTHTRIALELKPETPKKESLTIEKNDIILVTGGARGVTAACLIRLAKMVAAQFILLGRTPLEHENESEDLKNATTEIAIKQILVQQNKTKTPKEINQITAKILANREVKQTIDQLEQLGAKAHYFSTDVLNITALETTLNQVRKQLGPIKGIIHGAGVLADKLITEKTIEQFNSVFNTKVIGLKNLLQLTQNDALKTLVLFSSIAGREGNIGQCDYAMANEILNKVAQSYKQKNPHCLVKSFNWGPWESGMVTAGLKAEFEKRGIAVLPLDIGTQMFVDELCDHSMQIEIVCGGKIKLEKTAITYQVDEKKYPFLMSHVIQQIPVIPACLALDWFLQSAKKIYPNQQTIACRNLKVLKGIQLNNFPNQVFSFTVHAEKNQLTLHETHNNTLHYSAEINPLATTNHQILVIELNNKKVWSSHNIYPEKLFHGPKLQAIHQLNFIADNGGEGEIKNSYALNWSQHDHQIDIASIDGVLQLIRLWGLEKLGKPTLPTQINEFILHRAISESAILRCIFKAELKGHYRILADAILLQADGTPYAEIKGIEHCAVPG